MMKKILILILVLSIAGLAGCEVSENFEKGRETSREEAPQKTDSQIDSTQETAEDSSIKENVEELIGLCKECFILPLTR